MQTSVQARKKRKLFLKRRSRENGKVDFKNLHNSYRFGFNGQHKDNEIKEIGNSLDFGARIYDSRLGKLLSIDPLSKKFPSETNYGFAGNNPISLVDEEGKKKIYYLAIKAPDGKVAVIKTVKLFETSSHNANNGIIQYKQHYNTEQTATLDLRGSSPHFSVAPEKTIGQTDPLTNAYEGTKEMIKNIFDLPVQVMVFGNSAEYGTWLNSNPTAKEGKKTFTVDMKEFGEIAELILLGQENLTPKKNIEIPKADEIVQKAVERAFEASEQAEQEEKGNATKYCPDCEKYYDKNGKPADSNKVDKSVPKDTINSLEHER